MRQRLLQTFSIKLVGIDGQDHGVRMLAEGSNSLGQLWRSPIHSLVVVRDQLVDARSVPCRCGCPLSPRGRDGWSQEGRGRWERRGGGGRKVHAMGREGDGEVPGGCVQCHQIHRCVPVVNAHPASYPILSWVKSHWSVWGVVIEHHGSNNRQGLQSRSKHQHLWDVPAYVTNQRLESTSQ